MRGRDSSEEWCDVVIEGKDKLPLLIGQDAIAHQPSTVGIEALKTGTFTFTLAILGS